MVLQDWRVTARSQARGGLDGVTIFTDLFRGADIENLVGHMQLSFRSPNSGRIQDHSGSSERLERGERIDTSRL